MERSLGTLSQNILLERLRLNRPAQQIVCNDPLVRHIVMFHQRIQNDQRLCRIIRKLPLLQANRRRIFRRTVLKRLDPPENLPNPRAAQQLRRHPHRISQCHPVQRPQDMISHTITSFTIQEDYTISKIVLQRERTSLHQQVTGLVLFSSFPTLRDPLSPPSTR